jgi:hypothetical protein
VRHGRLRDLLPDGGMLWCRDGPAGRELRALAAALLAFGCSRPMTTPTSSAAPPKGTGSAAWEQIKRALPGSWTMPGKSGPFRVSYKLISGDSALVETWGVGSGRETMTIFHPDHDDLLLTHYCAQGNQPRLRAVATSADGIVFRFADATNLGQGQAILIERVLRLKADTFDDTEVYRGADGAAESTTYHFTRIAQGPP